MHAELDVKTKEERIKRKKIELVADSILGVFVEQNLTINECRQALKEAEITLERDIGKAIIKRND